MTSSTTDLRTNTRKARLSPLMPASPTGARKRGTDLRGGGVERIGSFPVAQTRSRVPEIRPDCAAEALSTNRHYTRYRGSCGSICFGDIVRQSLSRVSVRPASPNLCPTMGEPAGSVAVHDDAQRSQIAKAHGVSGRVAHLHSFAAPKANQQRLSTALSTLANLCAWVALLALAFGYVAFIDVMVN